MITTNINLLKRLSRKAPILQTLSVRNLSKGDIKAQMLLDEIYTVILGQKFKDIVVIETKFNADPRYIILANAFSHRHLTNGTEMVNKHYKVAIKQPDENFARVSIAKDWNVVDFESVVVHLFSKETRDHFDIEQLWAVGESYDDLTNMSNPRVGQMSSSKRSDD